jgi:predicted nucleotidyltransferase
MLQIYLQTEHVDLSSPLRSLIPSLDSAVLEVLVGTQSGLSASQIARLSVRGTRAGQGAVLDRLVQHGLVLAHRANTGYLFRFNREHVLAPAVLVAVAARQEFLDRLATATAALDPVPVSAALYGSFVRREAGSDSDVDLLLVLENTFDRHAVDWQAQLDDLERKVLAWTGNRLEVLQLSVQQLADATTAGEPLMQSLRDQAVTLHGRDVANLLATVGAGVER